MAGNSARRGAVRKPGTKKGPSKGTGGLGRRALEGRGPTPKAEDRPYHPAAKRKAAAEKGKAAPARTGRSTFDQTRSASRSGGHRPAHKPDSNLVVGRNAVLEALRAAVPATRLELANYLDSDPRLREIVALAADLNIPMAEVSSTALDRRSQTRHQGVVLTVQEYQYVQVQDLLTAADDAGRPAFIVALDSITDPHNLGAVIRSAAAFGADGVLIPARRAAGVTPAAWKVSAGAAARLPVARATNLVQALVTCQRAGCSIIGLDGRGSVEIDQVELLSEPVVLVIGAEGQGLGRLVRETCDLTARINIGPRAESLNASVAAGIALHQTAQARCR